MQNLFRSTFVLISVFLTLITYADNTTATILIDSNTNINNVSLDNDTNFALPPSIRRSLKSAANDSLVSYHITGAYVPNPYYRAVDGNGMHFGQCMGIMLTNRTDSTLVLTLDCGMQLLPLDSTFQTMIVTKALAIEIPPHYQWAQVFDAMCGQIHDGPPAIYSPYIIGELADSNVVKIANYLNIHDIQTVSGQHAIWAYTDKITVDEIRPYGMDSLSLLNTIDILNHVGVITKLNPPKPIVVATPVVSDEMTIRKLYVYVAGGTMLLMLIVIIVLSLKRRTS